MHATQAADDDDDDALLEGVVKRMALLLTAVRASTSVAKLQAERIRQLEAAAASTAQAASLTAAQPAREAAAEPAAARARAAPSAEASAGPSGAQRAGRCDRASRSRAAAAAADEIDSTIREAAGTCRYLQPVSRGSRYLQPSIQADEITIQAVPAACLPYGVQIQMCKMEKEAMWPFKRNGDPFNAYFKQWNLIVQTAVDARGMLLGFAITGELGRTGVFLYELHVAKTHRNRGLGTALLALVQQQQHFAKMTQVELHVHRANSTARNFYRNQGFKERDVLGNESVLVMWRALTLDSTRLDSTSPD